MFRYLQNYGHMSNEFGICAVVRTYPETIPGQNALGMIDDYGRKADVEVKTLRQFRRYQSQRRS